MANNNLKSIGKKIKEYRLTKNMTQDDLANQLQMSTRQIGEIETGNSLSSIEVLFDISSILNIPLDLLFMECDKQFLIYAIDDYLSLIDKQKISSVIDDILDLVEQKQNEV